MEQIRIEHLTFSYGKECGFSLKDISTVVKKGEFVLVIGESGCGKTTLLRHLKVDYMPVGIRSEDARILIDGTSLEKMSLREKAGFVGFVRQNPESAQVMDKVWHELAFGLESLGYSQEQMQRKVAEMVAFFGLEGIYDEKLCNLSGGQKQLVNLAAVMVMEPEVLVLDEPTSQLDPVAATEFFHMVERIHRELGTTIVMTEHRLEEVYGLCDRVLVMESGRIVKEGTPQHIAVYLWEQNHLLFGALPSATRLYLQLNEKFHPAYTIEESAIPLTVRDGRNWLEDRMEKNRAPMKEESAGPDSEGATVSEKQKPAFQADELWFRYHAKGTDVLRACSLSPEQRTITAILGGNGTGKSTMLHVLAGHYQPLRGRIKQIEGSIALMPQNPQAMFTKDTVWEELCVSAAWKDREKKECEIKEAVRQQSAVFGLQGIWNQHPFDLSGGEMQKLALAKLILSDYDILLLDEPGKGMDYQAKEEMGRLLQQLAKRGKTIVLVSHDVEFCAKYADVCGLFFDGHIVSLCDAKTFFLQNAFYTTAVRRMCRNRIDGVVTVEDVLDCFGVKWAEITCEWQGKDGDLQECPEAMPDMSLPDRESAGEQTKGKTVGNRRRDIGKISWINPVVFFVIMPLTIYFGHTILRQRKYYFIPLLLVLEALTAFLLTFEKGRPKLKKMMVIAVMTAITVAGRAAFYMVPNVKPMAALTILSGIGLGGEAGFLIGALSMLVSNIFFGQGPWTPWQMMAMGMLGMLSGLIFKRDTPCDKKKLFGICLFGFVAVLVVYGGIMNPASVLMYQEHVNWEMILSAYGLGLPFDLIHAAGTVVFLLVGARPILKKLKRVTEVIR